MFVDTVSVLSVSSKPTPGFTIGILGNLRLAEYWDMRFIPSLSFGERLLMYNLYTIDDGEESIITKDKSITSTFIDFPLEFRYKSKRLNNFRAYVLGGVKYTLDLASQKKQQEQSDEIIVKIDKHDLSIEAGVGIEFYTTYQALGFKENKRLSEAIQGVYDFIKNSIPLLKEDKFYDEDVKWIVEKIEEQAFINLVKEKIGRIFGDIE